MYVAGQWGIYHTPNFKCLITNYPHAYLFSLPDGLRLTLRPGLFLLSQCCFQHVIFSFVSAATLKAEAQSVIACVAVCLQPVSVLEAGIPPAPPNLFIMGQLGASSWNLM